MSLRAVIDIGTNSALLLIGRINGAKLIPVAQRIATPRIGRGVAATGRIDPAAFADLTAVLAGFQAEIRSQDADLAAVAATEAFRRAANGAELLDALSRQLGVPCRILSGEAEARLAYQGVRSLYSDPDLWVLDIGGGSTEVNAGSWGRSLPVGAVNMTERFASDSDAALQAAAEAFSVLPKPSPGAALVAVGGTASALALLEQGLSTFDAERVEGFTATVDRVRRWRRELYVMSVADRNKLPGLETGRGEILPAGLTLCEAFLEHTGFAALRVSDRGLRYGLLWESGKATP